MTASYVTRFKRIAEFLLIHEDAFVVRLPDIQILLICLLHSPSQEQKPCPLFDADADI